jgi:hypothetical protein
MPEVLVVGGGPAGLGAAVAAARQGADTLLIERYGFLGGMATAGLVNPFMSWHAGGRPLVAGIFQEMLDRMKAKGGYGSRRARHAFDPEIFKLAADELCGEAGVKVRLHTLMSGVEVECGRITSITTESKSGRESWTARGGVRRPPAVDVYIDCTGDADLAFLAGVPCEHGRPEDHLTQPMTLNFRMAGVDIAHMPTAAEINHLFDVAKEEGRVTCPRENLLWFHTTRTRVVHFNTTRVTGMSGVRADELTQAETEARRQAHEIARFLISDVPGFKCAYLQQTGAQIGVRESRRIRGAYVLTGDDVVGARKFPDGIARCNYPIDIHNPAGSGTVIREVPAGDYYEVPYRCLLPVGIENLLVGGRCVSATHEGQSSLRVMPQCFAMGQAAGTAAALSAQQAIAPRQIAPDALRAALREQGQIV